MSDSARPHRRQPTRLPRPWDSPGKNTGVGCHFLLQCMKVRSESEVAQSCPSLSNPMDCSLSGSSTHGIFQAKVLEWGAKLLRHKNKWNFATCNNMDGPRVYHTKWSKSEKDRQIPYDVTYMWNLKYDTKELMCRNRLTDIRQQTHSYQRRKEEEG